MKHKGLALAIGGLALAGLAACGPTQSSSSAAAVPSQRATAQATAGCPAGMSPDVNGVCNPGGNAPTSPPDLATGNGTANVPGTQMTASQQQAVTSAQGYLTDGQGFSYKGLLDQLTSQYGEGFSQADAKFAIGYLHPDWNAQAVIAAKGYLSDGQGFSRQSLISQLDSPYGGQFTYDQAVYAVNQVGLH